MKKSSKKQRVEKYLNQLMKGRYFKIEDLLALSASKLQENTPLLDISQSTIVPVLRAYKEKYDPKKRKPSSVKMEHQEPFLPDKSASLLPEETVAVRKIIAWFEAGREDDLVDFKDLKSALSDIGIDYIKLLKQYRNQK